MEIICERIKLKVQDVTDEVIELELPKITYKGKGPKNVILDSDFKIISDKEKDYLLFREITLHF